MQAQREKVRFETNIPETVTLQYPAGKMVSGRFGEQVMWGLAGGLVMFLDLGPAQRLNDLNPQQGESFVICKRGGGAWDVRLSPGTEKMRSIMRAPAPPAQEEESQVMQQMRGTMRNIEEGRPPAAPRPVPVSPAARNYSGASVSAPAPVATTANTNGRLDSSHNSNPLVIEANALVDAYAAALAYASEKYGNQVNPEAVRALVTTAYISRSKGGAYAAA